MCAPSTFEKWLGLPSAVRLINAGAVTVLLLAPVAPLLAQEVDTAVPRAARGSDLQLQYGYSAFRDDTRPWHVASASLRHRATAGTGIIRVNYARRFDTDGLQVELDAYPRLSDAVYAYLNAGYGFSGSFPAQRFGAELFAALPAGWELSGGMRHLRFDARNVTLFTGSVGHYVGNAWISLRPWVQTRSDGTTASATLQARYYFEDADNFIGGRIGYGSTPSEQLVADALDRTDAFQAALEGSRSLRPGLIGTWSVGFEREQFAAGRDRSRIEVLAGVRIGL